MIKIELIDLIKDTLPLKIRGPKLENLINFFYIELLARYKQKGMFFDKWYKTYTNIAITDGCSEIPVEHVEFDTPCFGIRIRTDGTYRIDFVPQDIIGESVRNDLEIAKVSNIVGYSFYDGVIKYDNPLEITSVSMDIVRPFKAYDNLEDIYIPQNEISHLSALVASAAAGKYPTYK